MMLLAGRMMMAGSTAGAAASPPVWLDTEILGTNTSGTTFDMTPVAYSTGDLVIVGIHAGWGENNTIALTTTAGAATGPDGETLITVQAGFDNDDVGSGGVSTAVFAYIAAADRATPTAILRCTSTPNNTQITASVTVFDAGTFNTTTPISNVSPLFYNATATHASAAFTAANANGKVLFLHVSEFDGVNSVPAGWTALHAVFDPGALAAIVTMRDAATTASEAVAAANHGLSAAQDGTCVTLLVNPA